MKKFFENKFSKIILYIIALTILIIFLSVILIWHYSTNIVEDYQSKMINAYQQNVLKNVDKNYNQMLKATMQIFDDTAIRDFLMFESYDEEQIAQAQKNYKNYLFYFDLNAIHVVNKRTDSVWNDQTVIRESLKGYRESQKLNELMSFYENGYNFVSGESLQVVDDGLYYIYSNFQGYTFILDMKKEKYEKDILKYLSPFKCNTWMYYRDRISFTDSDKIGDVVKEYEIKTGELKEGVVTYLGDICILRQKLGQFNMFTIIPFNEIRGDIYERLSFLAAVAAVIVIFCIVILIIYYQGFKNVQNAYIKKQILLEEGIWDNILYKVFSGNKLSESECGSMMDAIAVGGGVYRTMLVIADSLNAENDEELNKKHSELEGIINEAFGGINHNELQLEKGRIGIVLRYERADGDYVDERIEYLHRCANENKIAMSIIVQSCDDRYEEFEENVFELFKMSLYQFICDEPSIIKASSIPETDETAEYPKNIQGKIILAIKNGDEEEFSQCCTEFTEYIRANNYLMGRKWGSELYSGVADVFEPDGETELGDILNIGEIYEKISEKWLTVGDKTDEFYNGVKKLIEENYSDSSYCIASIAEAMGISVVYAGRKFKKAFDKTFNMYLAEYRCLKAGEYLTETNKKSAEIAELCGFTNTAYYNHTFKKYMKLAPLQYREAYKVVGK